MYREERTIGRDSEAFIFIVKKIETKEKEIFIHGIWDDQCDHLGVPTKEGVCIELAELERNLQNNLWTDLNLE